MSHTQSHQSQALLNNPKLMSRAWGGNGICLDACKCRLRASWGQVSTFSSPQPRSVTLWWDSNQFHSSRAISWSRPFFKRPLNTVRLSETPPGTSCPLKPLLNYTLRPELHHRPHHSSRYQQRVNTPICFSFFVFLENIRNTDTSNLNFLHLTWDKIVPSCFFFLQVNKY